MKSVSADMGLKAYEEKRNFRETSEPKPRVRKPKATRKLTFVIQKHDASRLHYDFRLEMEGVLKSWAVPKGIPMQRGKKHLAVHVEDHPMDYAHFEGTIPKGNYGAGTVMVWDTGIYEVMGTEPLAALKEGKMHLQMSGKKLRGEWALIRIKPRPGEKESWLLFKGGSNARPLSLKKEDESALSGRSMAAIARDNDAQWTSDRESESAKTIRPALKTPRQARALQKPVAPKKSHAALLQNVPKAKIIFVPPMRCRLTKEPPSGDDWVYEIKFDGFRILALKRGEEVELASRTAKDLTSRFREIADAVRKLPMTNGIVDGEVVALDEKGRSSFQLLQMADMPGEAPARLCFYAFDLLNLEGKNLTGLPLSQRKEILQTLISPEHEPVRYSANITGDPKRLLKEIRKRGLEGIIAKKRSGQYEPGARSGSWAKIKIVNGQEFVIGGFTAPKGSRDHFGAVLVGYFEKDKFLFASKVGTGFNQALLTSLHDQFKKIERTDCPFANLPEKRTRRYVQGVTRAEMKRCTWVEPKLVCQIHFTEWTRDEHLRHPVFMGLREDKRAKEVVREN